MTSSTRKRAPARVRRVVTQHRQVEVEVELGEIEVELGEIEVELGDEDLTPISKLGICTRRTWNARWRCHGLRAGHSMSANAAAPER